MANTVYNKTKFPNLVVNYGVDNFNIYNRLLTSYIKNTYIHQDTFVCR